MRRQKLIPKAARKFKVTTDSDHQLPIIDNLHEQDNTNINLKKINQIISVNKVENYLLYTAPKDVLGILDTMLTVLVSLVIYDSINYIYQKHAGIVYAIFKTNTEN